MARKVVTAYVRACCVPNVEGWTEIDELFAKHSEFAKAHDAMPVHAKSVWGKEFREALDEEFDGPWRVTRRRLEKGGSPVRGYQGVELTHWESGDDE